MKEYLLQAIMLPANGMLGVILYWVPACVLAFVYALRTIRNINADIEARNKEKHYRPQETVGTIIGRIIMLALPVLNWCGLVAETGAIIRFIESTFNFPLVPPRPSKDQS